MNLDERQEEMRQRRAPRKMTPEIVATIRTQASSGVREAEIARRCGVSETSVRVVLANSGGLPKNAFLDEEARQLRRCQEEARQQADERRLAQAVPDGTPCTTKACPFPAVLEGKCRQHFRDSIALVSLMPSTLPPAYQQ